MANVVRDIMVNVSSGDLKITAANTDSHTFYEVVWGYLTPAQEAAFPGILLANVIIPISEVPFLTKDSDGRYLLFIKSHYTPISSPFQFIMMVKDGNEYKEFDEYDHYFPDFGDAYIKDGSSKRPINASELPFINMDGYYLVEFKVEESGHLAFVYSPANIDFEIGGSDLQSSQLLTICDRGKYYKYPTTGVGATNYIGSVVAHTDLDDKIVEQFRNNGTPVLDASFDRKTGELDVSFFNEDVIEEDGLVAISDLNMDNLDISDETLAELQDDIPMSEYSDETVSTNTGMEPPTVVESCFANGFWLGNKPWTGDLTWVGIELWKNKQ